jgi:energy-coupling factor transporter ATP-binding protein EcfA2
VFQVEIKGFQSIDHVSLTLQGFTTLVGKTNIGKSAVVRALQCALTNGSGTYFVRHGESCARVLRDSKTCKCFSSVHIKGDSFNLLWEKGDSVNRYLFNGVEYDSPGQGTPDFLIEAGFGPVKIGNTSSCIQVADQFKPLFLLDQSGPAVAEAISDVSGLDRISRATKQVERERKETVATKRVREKDVVDLGVSLGKYAPLKHIQGRLSEVESQLVRVESATLKASTLAGYSSRVPLLEQSTLRLLVVDSLGVPDMEGVKSKGVSFRSLNTLVNRASLGVGKVNSLSWVGSFLSGELDFTSIQTTWEVLLKVGTWIKKLRAFKLVLPNLEAVIKEVVPTAELEGILQPVRSMESYSKKHLTLVKVISDLESKWGDVERELLHLEQEFDSLGVCPTCNQAIHSESRHA